MGGVPRPSAARQTVLDPPDPRMPPNPVPKLSAKRLGELQVEGITDPRLRAVSRCFMRWAVTHGDGETLPLMAKSEPLYLSSHDRPPPLEGADSVIVDAVYKSAPGWARHFVKLWFREQLNGPQVQARLSIKRLRAVYEERDLVLAYFLGRLVEAGVSLDARGRVGDL